MRNYETYARNSPLLDFLIQVSSLESDKHAIMPIQWRRCMNGFYYKSCAIEYVIIYNLSEQALI